MYHELQRAFYNNILSKLRDPVTIIRRALLSKVVSLLLYIAHPHVACLKQYTFEQLQRVVLPHLPYSPDLSPCDYHHIFRPCFSRQEIQVR